MKLPLSPKAAIAIAEELDIDPDTVLRMFVDVEKQGELVVIAEQMLDGELTQTRYQLR